MVGLLWPKRESLPLGKPTICVTKDIPTCLAMQSSYTTLTCMWMILFIIAVKCWHFTCAFECGRRGRGRYFGKAAITGHNGASSPNPIFLPPHLITPYLVRGDLDEGCPCRGQRLTYEQVKLLSGTKPRHQAEERLET